MSLELPDFYNGAMPKEMEAMRLQRKKGAEEKNITRKICAN